MIMAWHNIKDYKRHKDMVIKQQCDCWTHKTFSSEALPELETLSEMSAPGKVNITKLDLNCVRRASLNLIHFSLLFFFELFIFNYIVFLFFFYWFINKRRKRKIKDNFFCFSENYAKRRSYTSDKSPSTERWWQWR